MAARAPDWQSQENAPPVSKQIEADLARLRQLVLERHDIRIPVNDPICIDFTVFTLVMERALSDLQQQTQENIAELSFILKDANYTVRQTLDNAGKPLARAMHDAFDPRAVADQVASELFDDLRRVSKDAVLEVRRIACLAIGLTFVACLAVLYVANGRLATAEAMERDAAVAQTTVERPRVMDTNQQPTCTGSR